MAEAVRLRRAVPTRSAAQITDIIARAMACFYPSAQSELTSPLGRE